MGIKDIVTKEFTEDTTIFADAFNFLVYDGEQVIQADDFDEQDPVEKTVDKGNESQLIGTERIRDLKKMLTVRSDGETSYIIMAIENQSDINRVMPLRADRLDSMTYTSQWRKVGKKHKNNNELVTKTDILSGWLESDRLIPVITLVIYFGSETWNVPTSLHEMMGIEGKPIAKYVPDYKINLIAPALIPDEDFEKFHSELGQVLRFIKHSKDKDEMEKYIGESTGMPRFSPSAIDVVNAITGTDFRIPEGEESLDMCKAIEEMKESSKAQGRAEGKAEGKAEGEAEGKLKTLEAIIANMLDLGESPSKIMKICSVTLDQVKEVAHKKGIVLA